LNDIIGLSVKGTVRRYKEGEKKIMSCERGKKKLRREVNVYDIVPKCHNIYAYVLPDAFISIPFT